MQTVRKKLSKRLSILLSLVLAAALSFLPVRAAECPYTVDVSVTPQVVNPGGTVTFTCELKGYDNLELEDLQGVQINIFNITEDMKVLSRTSGIPEHANKPRTSYNKVNHSIVLFYLTNRIVDEEAGEVVEYLPRSTKNLLTAKVQLPETMPESKEYVFPVQVILIQKGSIDYTIKTELKVSVTDEPIATESVEIEWGKMDFEWNNGSWNPQTLTYVDQGWTNPDGGEIRLSNTGNTDTKAAIRFTSLLDEVKGTILSDTGESVEVIDLLQKQVKNFHLKLEGKPQKALNHEKIGEITIRLGGE